MTNIDCDMYSSTWDVFSALKSRMKVGTIIYFDEYADKENEMRAFDEFMRRTDMKFKLLIEDRICSHMVFERIA